MLAPHNTHGRRRKLTPASCPLTSTCVLCDMCIRTHTHCNKNNNYLQAQFIGHPVRTFKAYDLIILALCSCPLEDFQSMPVGTAASASSQLNLSSGSCLLCLSLAILFLLNFLFSSEPHPYSVRGGRRRQLLIHSHSVSAGA